MPQRRFDILSNGYYIFILLIDILVKMSQSISYFIPSSTKYTKNTRWDFGFLSCISTYIGFLSIWSFIIPPFIQKLKNGVFSNSLHMNVVFVFVIDEQLKKKSIWTWFVCLLLMKEVHKETQQSWDFDFYLLTCNDGGP